MVYCRWLLCILFVSLCSPVAARAEPAERSDANLVGFFTHWIWEFDPATQPYPEYVADPRRPRMQVGISYIDTDIEDTSSSRIMLDTGTRYTLFGLKTDPKGINRFALDIEGALFCQFDAGNSLDSIGWDGVYGILAVYDWDDTLKVRAGYRHLSAHLGDEYMLKTGRERINYTRDSLVMGFAWALKGGVTAYVEPSWAIGLGNAELEAKWGLAGGVQYQGPFDHWNGNSAFFSGVHLRSFKETDWKPGVSVVAGYLIKRDQRSSNIRLQMEFYTGRAILGEFALTNNETYVTAGLVFDFY